MRVVFHMNVMKSVRFLMDTFLCVCVMCLLNFKRDSGLKLSALDMFSLQDFTVNIPTSSHFTIKFCSKNAFTIR